ncbi:MAG: NYN domain-containing protein [Chloroflexota bacterium]|nr:NYN domain-containing protein [Chloroflexota bacterium]
MTEPHNKKPVGIAALLDFGRRRADRTRRYNQLLPPPSTACVYVDIENLKNSEHARAVIETVVRDWPDGLPRIGRLRLYAPADKTGLWGAWAPARFSGLEVRVRGVQRFARDSKNSADMAIVADAVADFTSGAANHIAVVSNDSDFGALFVKIQELASRSDDADQPPFLWINLAGGSGLSKEIQDFVPEQLRWVVTPPPGPRAKTASKPAQGNGEGLPANSTIVRWLLDELSPGKFRAGDVEKIIKRHCPNHPAAQTTGTCGAFLARQLMPLLGDKGVTVVRQNPRTYELAG